MDVKLIAVSPKGTRRTFPLAGDVTTLGRADCNLRIPLEEISRHHCQVTRSGETLRIKDLGSSNGTFVNDERIMERELQAGDVICLANALKMLVQIDREPAEIDDDKLRETTPKSTKPDKDTSSGPPKPASSSVATTAASTDTDAADEILSESFFLDLEDDEEED